LRAPDTRSVRQLALWTSRTAVAARLPAFFEEQRTTHTSVAAAASSSAFAAGTSSADSSYSFQRRAVRVNAHRGAPAGGYSRALRATSRRPVRAQLTARRGSQTAGDARRAHEGRGEGSKDDDAAAASDEGPCTWLPFEEAREYVQARGLKSEMEWRAWSRGPLRPSGIPSNPNIAYAKAGWRGYRDWLGSARWRLGDQDSETAAAPANSSTSELWELGTTQQDKDANSAPRQDPMGQLRARQWVHTTVWLQVTEGVSAVGACAGE